MSAETKCGCKGIRMCLLCEKQRDAFIIPSKNEEKRYVYIYCPGCNLCWPDDEAADVFGDFPLHLGKVKVIPEFCSEEEESLFISSIDKIPWMPSQSGRRKQDFGPKVNFKKKKVKVGEFKGFPYFTEKLLKKLKEVPELSDFEPVELCHLEYSPERGSSIDPHLDDIWLWGERLVTVNLESSTVLTLEPCSKNTCECHQQFADSSRANALFGVSTNGKISCNHALQRKSSTKNCFETLSISDTCASKNHNSSDPLKNETHDSKLLEATCGEKLLRNSSSLIASKTKTEESRYSESHAGDMGCNNVVFPNSSEISQLHKNERETVKTLHPSFFTDEIPSIIDSEYICLKNTGSKINSMCNAFRISATDSKVCARIVLPPRSLFILAGCARYNWFHEIKRQDVVSRRLGMTFRELTAEFLDGGKESQCGKDLLCIANNFYDV